MIQAQAFAQLIKPDSGKTLLKSEDYIKRYGNIANTLYRIKTEKNVNVVFFGGSITNMVGWRGMVSDYLSKTYPKTKFNFLNAGIPSLGSLPHAFRLKQDVLSKGRIDLMFLESAVNDRGNGTNLQTQRRALEGIIRHTIRNSPNANIIIMAFVDPDKMKDYNSGTVPPEVQLNEDIAKTYHVPFINLAKEVTDRINVGEFSWDKDFKSLHPSPFGQDIYFRTMKQLLSVELARLAPAKLMPSYLPAKTEALAYANGDYKSVEDARLMDGFTLDPSWKPTDGIHGRDGFVNVPALIGVKPGAVLELSFTGNMIGIAVVSGPDAGIIKYKIDNKAYPELDLYTRWSYSLHLPWYLLLGDDLPPGKHVLRLEVSANKNPDSKGTACRIVHFLINN